MIFLSLITGGIALIYYALAIPFALSPLAESLWRSLSGVRPLRLRKEKQRLIPLFHQVYRGAVTADPKLTQKIRLYIKEDMGINAFAFGRRTLVLTRGSITLLSDDCIKGLIAHEFGHFSHYDTVISLFITVTYLPITLIKKLFDYITNKFRKEPKNGIISMSYSRKNEYLADKFALNSGFGYELTEVLLEIYEVSFTKPKSVKEQLRSSHPPITKRIERLENSLYG